jgi:hypothetical protein
MRIYYRQNQVPNFYIAFKEARDEDREQALSPQPGLAQSLPDDKVIMRGQDVVGYRIASTPAHQSFIRDNIVGWITQNAGWHGYDKNDLEAITMLKEWCVWLVAIETAVIAALAGFAKDVVLWWEPGYFYGRIFAVLTISALGFSIFWAIHMLLALPAISQRLPPPEPNNDIFAMQSTVSGRRLSRYERLVRYSFLVGFALCCHTFRATGSQLISTTAALWKNAQLMAAQESPRTTKLYDRTRDEITLDEVERIAI